MEVAECYPIRAVSVGAKVTNFNKARIGPGVYLFRFRSNIASSFKKRDAEPSEELISFRPTHLLVIEYAGRVEYVEKALLSEGKEVPEYSGLHRSMTLARADGVLRQVIIGLAFLGFRDFAVAGPWSLREMPTRTSSRLRFAGWSNSWNNNIKGKLFGPPSDYNTVSARQIKGKLQPLDGYFRGGIWTEDRISRATSHYWNAIFATSMDQSFLSLMTVIEALLSSDNTEVTHRVAQRVGVVLGGSQEERYAEYTTYKELAKTRAILVHGGARMKRMLTTEETAVISTFTMVSNSKMTSAERQARELIQRLLADKKYREVLAHKSEETVSRKIAAMFDRRLFGLADESLA